MNQFGEQIKQFREEKSLLQRQVANQLEMDTPMLSKIERVNAMQNGNMLLS